MRRAIGGTFPLLFAAPAGDSALGAFRGARPYDPVLIVAQIAAIQALYYLLYGVLLAGCSAVLPARPWTSMDAIFGPPLPLPAAVFDLHARPSWAALAVQLACALLV